MRHIFSNLLENEMKVNRDIVLITADLGYGLWNSIRENFSDRFINVLSSEQLMIGLASGLALEGKLPICYSITPFLLYRPFEFIRNLLDHDKTVVKLVGGGRDKDYGYLGFTHWAEDDMVHMNNFHNILKFKPINEIELEGIFSEFIYSNVPCYLNLKK